MKIILRIYLLTIFFCTVNIYPTEGEGVSTVGTLTSIKTDLNDNNTLPTDFILKQNHPNPFNPTTTISYAIPEQSYVEIKIYNISGSEVKVLVDEEQNAGYYNVLFNASNLSSGIYFYSIRCEKFTSTKKMILLK